jgi:hypothetical protein
MRRLVSETGDSVFADDSEAGTKSPLDDKSSDPEEESKSAVRSVVTLPAKD